ICLECFRDRDLVRQLPCRHFFHVQCIDRWLVQRTSVCPLCRVTVKREDEGVEGVIHVERGREMV
ncbi:hypothetical protein BDK51DRAFT_17309, partial [Blyttiomyces helicus]